MHTALGTRITLGGLGGTGKGSTSELLALVLGFKLMSAGKYFRHFAIAEGVANEEIEERAIVDPKYDKMLDDWTKEYGLANDHFVFEGRLAHHFIKGVHILLTCDLETRVKRIAGREKLLFEKAMLMTKHREEAAAKRYMKYYKILDITDPSHYTFVVDTTDITAEEVADKIISFLKLRGEYHPLAK